MDLGYLYTPEGECQPIQKVDLDLWRHGEGGQDPHDYGFKFKAGGKWYEVEVKVLEKAEVFLGWKWEARIIERFSEYKVNGVKGWGLSEWHYRHYGGRPSEYADKDPSHLKGVKKYTDLV